MKIFLVGGAVRDRLLGRPHHEHDYVVVGATPEELTALGYRPVGKDFPVFLHPATGEQYALARTERKTGPGYCGFATRFSPDVTLEEDLARRDLTINAMAQDDDGTLVDPHGGLRDLEARVLRHVSPAFVEDPLRVLRVARFAARFAPLGFRVAPETMELMRRIVAGGELAALVAERRYIVRPPRLQNFPVKNLARDDLYVLIMLSFYCDQRLPYCEGLRIAVTQPAWAIWSPIGKAIAGTFLALGDPNNQTLHLVIWLLHILTAFGILASLPYTKLFHIFSVPLNIYFRSLDPVGALPPAIAAHAAGGCRGSVRVDQRQVPDVQGSGLGWLRRLARRQDRHHAAVPSRKGSKRAQCATVREPCGAGRTSASQP